MANNKGGEENRNNGENPRDNNKIHTLFGGNNKRRDGPRGAPEEKEDDA